jgi:hypothetical protein
MQTTIFYHLIRVILCLQQTGEIDNLIVSWDKVLGCVVCRFHIAAGAQLHPGQVFWRHCQELLQSWRASTFESLVLSPTGSINLGFTTEGRLVAMLIITFSWGFQLGGYTYKTPTSTLHHQQVFWRHCRGSKNKKLPRQLRASKTSTSFLAPLPGRKKISARGVSRFQSFYFVIVLLIFFALFLLASFYQKYKKLVPL